MENKKEPTVDITELLETFRTDKKINPTNLFNILDLAIDNLETDAKMLTIAAKLKGEEFGTGDHPFCDYIRDGVEILTKICLLFLMADDKRHSRNNLHPFLKAYLEEIGITPDLIKWDDHG